MNNIKNSMFFFIFINLLFFAHKQLFSMKKSESITIPKENLEKSCSNPDLREERGCIGNLQELLIASGFYKIEEYIKKIMDLDTILKEPINDRPFKKKELEKWKNKYQNKIIIKTKQIENLYEKLDEFVEEYLNITNQKITNLKNDEPERISEQSEQSVPKQIEFFKICMKNISESENDLKSIFETIKSQKESYIEIISKDWKARNWEDITLPNLKKDSKNLSDILKKDIDTIWKNFISKRLLTDIFQEMQDKFGKNKSIKMFFELEETFNF